MSKIYKNSLKNIFKFVILALLVLTLNQLLGILKLTELKRYIDINKLFTKTPKFIVYEKLMYKVTEPKIGDYVVINVEDDKERKLAKTFGYIENIVYINDTPLYQVLYITRDEYGYLAYGILVGKEYLEGKILSPKGINQTEGKKIEEKLNIISKIEDHASSNSDIPRPSNTFKTWMWWITQNGQNIFVKNAQVIQFLIPDSDLLNFDEPHTQTKEVESLVNYFKAFFVSNGFKMNTKNSSKSIESQEFYDYQQAYEKDGEMCVIEVNGDIVGYSIDKNGSDNHDNNAVAVYIRCTNNEIINKAVQEQSKFISDLGLKNEVITIINQDGNSAYLSVHARRAGYYILTQLVNNKWIEIYNGQDMADCTPLDKYNFSKKIVDRCYDPITKENKTR